MIYRSLFEADSDDNTVTLIDVDPDDDVTTDVDGGFNSDEIEYSTTPDLNPVIDGGDSDVTDVTEESAMAAYELDLNWANIMEACGMHELYRASNGQTLYEAVDIKAAGKKFVDAIRSFVKKVAEWVQGFIRKIGMFFKNDANFFAKNAGKIKAGYNAQVAKGTKLKGDVYEYYNDNINSLVKDLSGYMNKNYDTNTGSDFANSYGDSAPDFDVKAVRTGFYNDLKIPEKYGDFQIQDPESVKNTIYKRCRGEKPLTDPKIDDICKSYNDLAAVMKSSKSDINYVKSMYKAFQKNANSAIKTMTKLYNDAAKSIENDNERKAKNDDISKASTNSKNMLKIINEAMVALCNILYARLVTYRRIAHFVAKGVDTGKDFSNTLNPPKENGEEEQTAQNASYIYNRRGRSFMSELDIL